MKATSGYLIAWALIAWILPCTLPGQASFYVELGSREVTAGEAFQIAFTAENGQAANFRPPDWNGLEVIQGPSRSMQSTFINGQMTNKTSYIFLVSAPKPGNYTLGPAAIELNGRKITTEPIPIKVREQLKRDMSSVGEAPYFIEASLDTNEVYLGQQVILEYKLYSRVEINSFDVLKAPSFQGMYVQGLPQFQLQTGRETINGITYVTKILRRLALFPQQSGVVMIEPMIFQLGLVDRDPNARSFIFSSRLKPVRVSTESLQLTVNKLPEPVPDDFCGAVGALAMSVNWDKSRISTDDAVTMRLTLSGDGDPKQLIAPNIDFGPAIEVFPPNLISEDPSQTSGRSTITRTWDYVLVPSRPGMYQLKFNLSYFDPDSARYVAKRSVAWPLTVIQGHGNAGMDPGAGKAAGPVMHTPDLFQEHHPHQVLLWGTIGFWLVWSVPLMAGLIIGRVHFLRIKESNVSPEEQRYKKARKEAQKLLEEARTAMASNDRQQFYRSAGNAFLGYTAHRLKVSPNNVRREDMRQYLSSAGVDAEMINRFVEFWDQLDMAQYAPVMKDIPLESIYEKAVRMVSELEAALEKI